jgi:hypothetical protein
MCTSSSGAEQIESMTAEHKTKQKPKVNERQTAQTKTK